MSTKFVDVGYLQADPENAGCMFQAASNFNGIEAIGEYSRPNSKTFITDYVDDGTQGPAASISAGPGAISRVLLPFFDPEKPASEWLQTRANQMEMLGDLGEYFTVRNGYVVQTGDEEKADEDLASESNRKFVEKVKVCVHADEEVVYSCRDRWNYTYQCIDKYPESENAPACDENVDAGKKKLPNHKICQVFCAAMNLGQGTSGGRNAELESDGVKEKLLLEAAYKGTYLAAIRHGCKKVFLTLIGGGVFGNSIANILDAIEKVHLEIACKEKNDVIQEVHIVLFNPLPNLQKFFGSLREKGVETEIHTFKNGKGPFLTQF